ncbi:MAG: hypothetical protein ABI461_10640 [Polyangiaceae bacterium]
MRTSLPFFFATFIVGSSFVFAACGGASAGNGFETPDAGSAASTEGGSLPDDSGGLGGGGGDGSVATGPAIFYVHTNDTLYSVDPANVSAPPKMIGTFSCIGKGSGQESSMTDIAVAKDGSLYAVSQTAAHPLTISGSNVKCTATWPLPSKNNNFYGLTVAPENTVDTQETLIAADDSGGLWKIDSTTGFTTQVGTLGKDPSSGKAWGLSGDIVFLANGGSPIGFATVRVNTTDTDTLIQLDVSLVKPGTGSAMKSVRGKVQQKSGCAAPTTGTMPAVGFGFKSMYGIAAYQDKVYGFSHQGDIVEIDNSDGTACLLNNIGSSQFSGAGITTSAPVVAPR